MRGASESSLQVLVMVIFGALILFVLFGLFTSGGNRPQAGGTPRGFGPEILFTLIPTAVSNFFVNKKIKGVSQAMKYVGVILIIVLLALFFFGLWSGSKDSLEKLLGPIVNFFNGVPENSGK